MDVHLQNAELPVSAIAAEGLSRRPTRPADYAAENRVLVALARELAASPRTILERLATTALDLCRAHSAGFSLVDEQERRFEWTAVVGAWAHLHGGGTPRDFSPCGTVLDEGRPLLFWHPERTFPYLAAAAPAIDEGLLLPFSVRGRAVGTIWVMSHDSSRRFDAEDLRVMSSLAAFASAAYEARRDAESRYQETLNSLPAAVYTTDAEGRITHFNNAVIDMAGRVPRIGVDRWCFSSKLFDAEGQPVSHETCAMAVAVKEGRSLHGTEVIIERPDGSRVAAVAYPTPLRDANGRITGAINVVVDVTDRKQLIAQLQEQDRRKDEFLATLAHELRNPLAPIVNSLQLMELAADRPSVVEHARTTIERQVKHMVRLVDDLLDISRITRNRIELRRERVSLASLVESAVETSRPAMEQARHVLDVSLPPEGIMIDGDPVRLAQALANILNNAAKYSEPGRRIVVGAERVGSEVLVRVRDEGIGIPVDRLTQVFEAFVQLDGSLERAQGGLGIGLTLVKRLVEMHGGRVEARSEGAGLGSEFLVWLPIAAATEGEPANSDRRLARADQPSRRVLIVDDNRDAAECLGEMLRILGHDVITAHDGLQALELAASFEPEIALLDLGMPMPNGYEIARRLRQNAGNRRPFLVAVTGWGQDEDRHRTREAGFDLHLVKPVEPSALETVMKSRPPA